MDTVLEQMVAEKGTIVDCFKILIPLWGKTHIDRFFKFPYMSLLAPGNLPYLATANRCALVFMITKDSQKIIVNTIRKNPPPATVTLNFIIIDDLVNFNNYGLTLSLAYERAIRNDPEEIQVNTHYVLMNGDFVLSNNTYVNMVRALTSGAKSILCPSVRVIEEYVNPKLSHLINSGTLDLSSRELIKISLQDLHCTVLASGFDSENITTAIAHQCYLKVSEEIFIARYFLLFMLCIKPEIPLQQITAFCDYSFIPEMCPSGEYKIITDSDDAFLMELSPKRKDSITVHFGKHYENLNLYNTLSDWVTDYQQNCSRSTLFFHTDDLPTQGVKLELLNNAVLNLDSKMAKIYNHLNTMQPRPSHKNHYYWVASMEFAHKNGLLLDRIVGSYDRPKSILDNSISNIRQPPTSMLDKILSKCNTIKFLFTMSPLKAPKIIIYILLYKFKAIVNKWLSRIKVRLVNLLFMVHKIIVNKILIFSYNNIRPLVLLLKKLSTNKKATLLFVYDKKFNDSMESKILNKYIIKFPKYKCCEIMTAKIDNQYDIYLAVIPASQLGLLLDHIKLLVNDYPRQIIIYINEIADGHDSIKELREHLASELSSLYFNYNIDNMTMFQHQLNLVNINLLTNMLNNSHGVYMKILSIFNIMPFLLITIMKSTFNKPKRITNLYENFSSMMIELKAIKS